MSVHLIVTDAEIIHRYDPSGGGLYSVELPPGTEVEVWRDDLRLGIATVSEPDRRPWRFRRLTLR